MPPHSEISLKNYLKPVRVLRQAGRIGLSEGEPAAQKFLAKFVLGQKFQNNMVPNKELKIQRVESPEDWIKKFWQNYKRATSVKVGPLYITCPNCGKIQMRFFHMKGKFRCSYCGRKGYFNFK